MSQISTSERIITIAGSPDGKGKTVGYFLEKSDEALKNSKEEIVSRQS